MKELVGCELIVQDHKIILHQRKIIVKLLQDFNNEIKDLKFKVFPMGNLTKVIRPSDDSKDLLSTHRQVHYQSGVGSLLYIVKHSRPDLNNSVRELSKSMDQSNEEGYKKLLQVLNFIKYTTNLGIIFETSKTLTWNLECYSDSDFAGDTTNRKSISGYLIYVNQNLIAWSSKKQTIVTTSSTEAEYVSLSDMIKEILFVKGILEFMKVKMQLPIKVHVDNKGEIFISQNPTVKRTKNIDTRYHFIRQYIKDGVIEIEFVRMENNKPDIMTKNFAKDKHQVKFEDVVKEVNQEQW